MNLAARRWARLREEFVMRLGCVLVSVAVLASLVLEPPKAKAFAVTSSAVTALAGGFLNACGLAPVVSGMSSSGEVNESLARLIQEYLDAEVPGVEIVDWLGDLSLKVNSGNKLVIPAAAAGALSAFAQWVAGKYGTQAGVNVVFSDQSITFADGSTYALSYFKDEVAFKNSVGQYRASDYYKGTTIPAYLGTSENNAFEITFYPGYSIKIWVYTNKSGDLVYKFVKTYGGEIHTDLYSHFYTGYEPLTFMLDRKGNLSIAFTLSGELFYYPVTFSDILPSNLVSSLLSNTVLSLNIFDTMQEILDRLTALEEGQSIALDVGATQSMEIQDILQGILDAILAGDLAASAEIVDEAVEPVDPDPPVVPAVPSGLDELGEALTSRFPFSIPWDVYKGVTLLAAPPKAPYFEVDFLAPIAHRVGGWQGSTTIVLDFSEYEVIGQVCRWTSTIGFCLMLAAGTKRLIWTA